MKKKTKKSGINFNRYFSLTEVRSLDTVVRDIYSWGFKTFEEGRDHLREIMRETVNEYTEGLSDDEVNIDEILDEIMEEGEDGENFGRWTWECSEMEIVWELQKFCKVPKIG